MGAGAAPGGAVTVTVDVGTTGLKVVARDARGRARLLLRAPSPGALEAVLPAVRGALEGEQGPVRRVGVTAHGQSALLVDRGTGSRVGEAIFWHQGAVAESPAPLGDDCVLNPAGSWLPGKLRAWREQNAGVTAGREPGSLVCLQVKDYINLLLTGTAASDRRSLRGLLNASGEMPQDVLEYVGLGDVCPALLEPEAVVGRVSAKGAAESGLPEGCEVICGCDDLSAGVLGLLPLYPGQRFNIAGSSEHLGVFIGAPSPARDAELRAHARASGLSYLPKCGRLPALLYSATSSGATSVRAAGVSEQVWCSLDPKRVPSQSEIDAMPAFDVNVDGRRGLDPDASHKGGWAADPSAFSEEMQAFRVADALSGALKPIDDALRLFADASAEMVLGGGLAASAGFAAVRRGSGFGDLRVASGPEVSAVGVARLAIASRRAVMFGAGKVGRGFLCQLLSHSGWSVVLVDAYRPSVDALVAAGCRWTVHNLATGQEEEISAEAVLHLEDDSDRVVSALSEADLVLTSMGANNLVPWAASVRKALCQRLRSKGALDIVLAENHPRPAAAVREALEEGASTEDADLMREMLGVAQAQVLRSCIEPTPEQGPLAVQVQDHWYLPLDRDALVTDLDMWGAKPLPNFERELTRKLFTYNCVNAVVCYVGEQLGLEWLAEAANNESVAEVAMAAGEESSAALVAEYAFDVEDQQLWCRRAMAKYQDTAIRDPIERNARDPVRKLSRYDRLMGPTYLCLKHGLPCENLAVGVAAALRYPGASMPQDAALEGLLSRGAAALDALLAAAGATGAAE